MPNSNIPAFTSLSGTGATAQAPKATHMSSTAVAALNLSATNFTAPATSNTVTGYLTEPSLVLPTDNSAVATKTLAQSSGTGSFATSYSSLPAFTAVGTPTANAFVLQSKPASAATPALVVAGAISGANPFAGNGTVNASANFVGTDNDKLSVSNITTTLNSTTQDVVKQASNVAYANANKTVAANYAYANNHNYAESSSTVKSQADDVNKNYTFKDASLAIASAMSTSTKNALVGNAQQFADAKAANFNYVAGANSLVYSASIKRDDVTTDVAANKYSNSSYEVINLKAVNGSMKVDVVVAAAGIATNSAPAVDNSTTLYDYTYTYNVASSYKVSDSNYTLEVKKFNPEVNVINDLLSLNGATRGVKAFDTTNTAPKADALAAVKGVFYTGTTGTIFTGTSSDDSIAIKLATGGSVDGGLGADTITGAAGSDLIDGGAGADSILGGAGNDTIVGNAGNDIITGGANDDSLTGGAGSDTFNVDAGTDTVTDFATGDTLNISAKAIAKVTVADKVYTVDNTAGTAVMSIANVSDIEAKATRIDISPTTLSAAGSYGLDATLPPVKLADNKTFIDYANVKTITGSVNVDTIKANGLGNAINGFGGNDIITAGAGADTITVDAGTDTINDFNPSLDKLIVIKGNKATVYVSGTTDGYYSVDAVADDVTVDSLAKLGTKILNQPVPLTLNGTATADNLTGAALNDTINGLDGNDTLNGLAGNDSITGGAGADKMDGGAGNDTYLYTAAGQASTGTLTVATGAVNTTALDIITVTAGDKVDLKALGAFDGSVAASTTAPTTASLAAVTGTKAVEYRGAYDGTSNKFSFGATGTDALLVYDNDGAGTGKVIEAIVLVGTGATADTFANGVLTIA
jgi:Ca2+-binding RTX toxin-like protein